MEEKLNIHYLNLVEKYISFKLRHDTTTPLDAKGWISLEDLIACSQDTDWNLSESLINNVTKHSKKQRFTIEQRNGKHFIRANQGHSLSVDLELQNIKPPEVLYHGTVQEFLPSILQEGLKKQKRQYVHLSFDTQTAQRVAQRRDKNFIILTIESKKMFEQGFSFKCSANNVWLTDHVPPRFISIKK